MIKRYKKYSLGVILLSMLFSFHFLGGAMATSTKSGFLSRAILIKANNRKVKKARLSSKRYKKKRSRRTSVSRRTRGYSWLPGEDLPNGHIEGIASYYSWKGGMHAACLVAPKGATVKVTSLETGKSINVVINDHGPFVPGRVIDLDRDAFRALFGSTGRGLGPVALDW